MMLNDSQTGERVAVATVNIPEQFVPEGYVLIKNYSENSGMFEQLNAQGIVGPSMGESPIVRDVIFCQLLVKPE